MPDQAFSLELKKLLLSVRDPCAQEFSRYFQENFGDSLLAVILYGSCLNEKLKKPTSIYDFILVCDSYWKFYRKKRYAVLNQVLQPNVHYLEIPSPFRNHRSPSPLGSFNSPEGRVRGEMLACKYNVLSLEHLKKATSDHARDIFILGRLGKRVGIVYAKDEAALDSIASCILSAMCLNLAFLLPTLPGQVALDDLIIRLLSMSYAGDFRIERETKVEELFEVEKDFYRYTYGWLTEKARDNGLPLVREGKTCSSLLSPEERERRNRQTVSFLRRSRRRSVYRWPKALMTFGNYLDYLLTKVERSTGQRIELTKWERRFPLILGWKHFFRLKRQGHLK